MGLFRKDKDLVYGQQGLERFVEAQKRDYKVALEEVKNGKKKTHWIWYVFPQMHGLGRSCYANLYGIKNKNEAEEYLKHKILGKRLREVTSALLKHEGKSAEDIFAQVLDRFYDGIRCNLTLNILKK